MKPVALFIGTSAIVDTLEREVRFKCVWECKHSRTLVTNIVVFTCEESDRCSEVNDTCRAANQSASTLEKELNSESMTRAGDGAQLRLF